jgi:toxin YoeB
MGIGKPEALKYDLAPRWSRRITQEHRYVYLVENETLFIFSLKGHY